MRAPNFPKILSSSRAAEHIGQHLYASMIRSMSNEPVPGSVREYVFLRFFQI